MLDRVAHATAQVVEVAERPQARGIRWVRVTSLANDRETGAAVEEASRRVRALGFVPLPARAAVPRLAARRLLHRHVVLFVTNDGDRPRAIDWIRRLSMASPRAHLVVEFRERRAGALSEPVTHLRERAVAEPSDCLAPTPAPLTSDWNLRERRAAATSRMLIAAGELAQAEGVLSGVAAEAAIQDVPVPAGIRLVLGQVYFWQGRFEEAQTQFDSPALITSEGHAWRALAAWARADRALTLLAIGRTAGNRQPSSLAALAHAMRGNADLTCASVHAFLGRPASASPLGRILDRVVVAEALLTVGRTEWAREVLGPAPPSHCGARIEDVVLARLRDACGGTPGDRGATGVRRYMQRTGAMGIARWGLGRPTMSVLHAVPALLQLVQESDDELLTLKRGCAWMRRHAGADAVGVVTADGRGIIAADGLHEPDLAEEGIAGVVLAGGSRTVAGAAHVIVASPMRYGGATIGTVVAKGRPEAAETLHEAAAALAALLGATVRARLDAVAIAGSRAGVAPEILGRSPSVAAVREAIARAAGTNFAVLIEGESGTGKELVARALHRLSGRRDRRFFAVNCAALTDELIEAELFGHARGAFTGAVGVRTGLFEEAHGSTLFLDEVSELSARGQAKLLRVLQEREIRRLGENLVRPVDVRVIAATNVPLGEAVAQGRFREDLLFRLAVVRMRVPALRDRVEDVPLLAQAFWKPLLSESGKRAILGPDAIGELCRHRWPGNVRELQNVMAALSVAAPPRGIVRARHVSTVLAGVSASPAGPAARLEVALRGFERQVVSAALARHCGRRTSAARELGLSRQGLTKAIRRLGLRSGT
jgi:two-component system response regulator HydG